MFSIFTNIFYHKILTMRLFYFSFLILLLSATSCKVSKQTSQLTDDGNAAFQMADYQSAFKKYQEVISIAESKGKPASGEVLQNAGISAWELGQTQSAIDLLEKAKQTPIANSRAIFSLAKAYQKIDNLSREITNLEEYIKRFPEGKEIEEVNLQLFIAYVESTNWSLAEELLPKLTPGNLSEEKTMVASLKLNQALGNDEKLRPLALKLLKANPNSIVALEVLANSYYREAEDSYQKEMKEYEKNRTNKQYKQLLAALEVINENFRKSRDYFEQLYKLNPDPRYATFLGNIYTRFENKQKADYYYKKAKE